jgi:hypothetical protein
MRALFRGEPSGSLTLPTLDDLLERLRRIEGRLANNEAADRQP